MRLPACSYNLLFYLNRVYMIDGVTRLGGLAGLTYSADRAAGMTAAMTPQYHYSTLSLRIFQTVLTMRVQTEIRFV